MAPSRLILHQRRLTEACSDVEAPSRLPCRSRSRVGLAPGAPCEPASPPGLGVRRSRWSRLTLDDVDPVDRHVGWLSSRVIPSCVRAWILPVPGVRRIDLVGFLRWGGRDPDVGAEEGDVGGGEP